MRFAHGRDNHPPQNGEAVAAAYKHLQRKYPNAEVIGATLDDYAREIWDARASLPVVTEELGDTWIHGIASHPERVASYKTMCRLRDKWISEDRFDPEENPRHDRFNRLIMCVPEHTWGIMVDGLYGPEIVSDLQNDRFDASESEHGVAWQRTTNAWEGDGFSALRRSADGRRIEDSWAEQVGYVLRAVDQLSEPQRSEAQQALAELRPEPFQNREGWSEVDPSQPVETNRFKVDINSGSGAIVGLEDRVTNRRWASRRHPIGVFRFENFARSDFDRFARQYLRKKKTTAWWSVMGFTKLGMDPDREIAHRVWEPEVAGIWTRSDPAGTEILTRLIYPDEAVTRFGAPQEVNLVSRLSSTDPRIDFEVRWFGKPAARYPAACWVGISPIVDAPSEWLFTKMGVPISPLEVIRRGNRRLHAVEEVIYPGSGPRPDCVIRPLDSPLCAPGRPSLTDFNQRQPGLAGGFWFNLWNNVWNTNFPYWHRGDCRFRFEMTSQSLEPIPNCSRPRNRLHPGRDPRHACTEGQFVMPFAPHEPESPLKALLL